MDGTFLNKQRLFLLLLLAESLLFSASSFAEPDSNEFKIKAAYLYNFTKFISWPVDEKITFNLCILGQDPFGAIISPIEKRSVKDKPIRLFYYQTASEIDNCHILYVGKSDFISSDSGALIVGESRDFILNGGNIAFSVKEGKIKLHINIHSLRDNGLEVSAKLLEIADVYQGGADD